jgi:hypothetical protein
MASPREYRTKVEPGYAGALVISGQLMDVVRLMLELRSERQEIEKIILFVERSDRLSIGRIPVNKIGRIGKPHTKTISELRSDRKHIEQALLSLEEYYRLTRRR